MTVVENKWLSGPYAPIPGDVTATELEVDRHAADRAERALPPQRPEPDHAGRPGHPPLVHRRRHGPRRAAPGGPGRLVPRPHGAQHARSARLLGEEPAPGERHGGFDGANTNVIGLAGRTFAIVEAGARPVELSYELDTVCHSDLERHAARTATPPTRRSTRPPGKLHAVAYHWALPHLQYIVIGADGLVEQVSPIDVTDGPMVHDCSITERWMVVYDLPVTLRPRRRDERRGLPVHVEGRPPGARRARSRSAATAPTCGGSRSTPCYVFHPLNAHDDGDRVVLDVVRYDRMFDAKRLGPGRRRRRCCGAGRSTSTTGTRARGAARRPCRSSSRASTSGSSAGPTAGATAPRCGTTTRPDNAFGGDLVRIDGKTGDQSGHRPRRRPRRPGSG